MRIKEIIITVGILVLSLTTLTGMVHTRQFQQAAMAETSGFDALAHDLFGQRAPGAHGE